jgi:hypothetical protein
MVFGDGDEQEREITTRLLLHYSKRRQATAKNQQRIVGGRGLISTIRLFVLRSRIGAKWLRAELRAAAALGSRVCSEHIVGARSMT